MQTSPQQTDCFKADLTEFLKKVVLHASWHARWLNTLSFLEHIGSRKLLKSQNSQKITFTLLQHISEEARHALFFKSLIKKVYDKPGFCSDFANEYLLTGPAAEDYFQNLDHKAQEELQRNPDMPLQKFLNYLYTTWMIEERACFVYKIYNQILQNKKMNFNLNFVLQEEDHHLKTVIHILQTKDPSFENRKTKLFQYEAVQFSELLKGWLNLVKSGALPR